jgi:CRISPR/Cas system type I-B associated protein Csh2 (Cas7 group RAMP superfamily)
VKHRYKVEAAEVVEVNINQPFHVGVADEVDIQEILVRLMDKHKVASMQEDHSLILKIVFGAHQQKVGDLSRKKLQEIFPLILE